MFTDYKFWYIKRNDDGFITECAVRFYEGEYQIVNNQERYVRTKRLESATDLMYLSNNNFIKAIDESNGKKAIVFNASDFGDIKTDDELCLFLNKELAKDRSRTPIKEQLWQL